MSNRRIQFVLFDLDDTLLDWSKKTFSWQEMNRPKINNIYDYLATEGHQLPSREQFFESTNTHSMRVWQIAKQTFSGAYLGTALYNTFVALDLEADRIDIDEVMRVYDWGPAPGVTLFPDTLAVLETLQEQGYDLGLVTNSFQPMWMRDPELEAFGLLRFFEARVTSGDTGYMKPHPAIYWRIMGMLRQMPYRGIFVGDRPLNDIAGANEVGLKSVLFTPGYLNHPLDDVVPDYTISSLSELLPILEELEK